MILGPTKHPYLPKDWYLEFGRFADEFLGFGRKESRSFDQRHSEVGF
jgi:hypothetical protein